jgi:hypothetical protein
LQARTGNAPVSIGTAQKETDLIPKLNRMPDGSLGVKVDTPNLHLRSAGSRRMPCPNPGPDRLHGSKIKVEVVHRIQNLGQ